MIRSGGRESLASALRAGVDMVELDVIGPPWTAELVVAHDLDELSAGSSFERALATLAERLPPNVEINVDLKRPGYEDLVAAALERHGLLAKTLVSTMEESSLAALRARHPQIALGWSLPRVRRDPLRNPLTAVPALAVLAYLRLALPSVAAGRIYRGEIDALMVHWRIATPQLACRIRSAGGQVYVWTVDDRDRIADMERMGVTGIISNNPQLFTRLN